MIEEKHYTIAELAKLLNIGRELTRRLVMNEPGVLKIGAGSFRTVYRIPEGVVQRILRRSANPA